MIRIILKSFFLCFLLISCTTDSNKTSQDLLDLGLSGKVKSVKEKSFTATEKFGEVVKIEEKRENPFDMDFFASFNKEGKILKKEDYKLDGALKWRSEYLYDDRGNRIAINIYDPQGKLNEKEIYEYDKNQNLIIRNYYTIEAGLYGTNERLINDDTYLYNEEGYVIQKTGGAIKRVYQYDDVGNLVEEDFYYEDRLNSKEIFEFDPNGHKISEKFYDSDGKLSSEKKFLYSNNGKLLEKSTFHSGEKFTLKFDPNENLIEEIEFKKNGTPIIKRSYEYTYDENKNWIKKIIFKNQAPTFILEREIAYYE